VVSGEDLVRRGRGELLFTSTLSAAGACAGLMLAALGIFGVVGFMVATRTREIGIRIALGATHSRVLGSVLVDALKVAAPGVLVGLLLAFVAAGETAWASQQDMTPLVYLGAVAIALSVALVAGLPAARRAAAVQPIVAMRAE
jgi:ABC-type antimicrobial peptide transport system permease subunit